MNQLDSIMAAASVMSTPDSHSMLPSHARSRVRSSVSSSPRHPSSRPRIQGTAPPSISMSSSSSNSRKRKSRYLPSTHPEFNLVHLWTIKGLRLTILSYLWFPDLLNVASCCKSWWLLAEDAIGSYGVLFQLKLLSDLTFRLPFSIEGEGRRGMTKEEKRDKLASKIRTNVVTKNSLLLANPSLHIGEKAILSATGETSASGKQDDSDEYDVYGPRLIDVVLMISRMTHWPTDLWIDDLQPASGALIPFVVEEPFPLPSQNDGEKTKSPWRQIHSTENPFGNSLETDTLAYLRDMYCEYIGFPNKPAPSISTDSFLKFLDLDSSKSVRAHRQGSVELMKSAVSESLLAQKRTTLPIVRPIKRVMWGFTGRRFGGNRTMVANDHFPFVRYAWSPAVAAMLAKEDNFSPLPFAKRVISPELGYPIVRRSVVAYFEVTIHHNLYLPSVNDGNIDNRPSWIRDPVVAIGLCRHGFSPMGVMPGWDSFSIGIHSDDGNLFFNREVHPLSTKFGEGDTIGLGILYPVSTHAVFESVLTPQELSWFRRTPTAITWSLLRRGGILVTKNGRVIEIIIAPILFHGFRWFPCVGVDSHQLVEVNFGEKPFRFDLSNFESGCEPVAGVALREPSTANHLEDNSDLRNDGDGWQQIGISVLDLTRDIWRRIFGCCGPASLSAWSRLVKDPSAVESWPTSTVNCTRFKSTIDSTFSMLLSTQIRHLPRGFYGEGAIRLGLATYPSESTTQPQWTTDEQDKMPWLLTTTWQLPSHRETMLINLVEHAAEMAMRPNSSVQPIFESIAAALEANLFSSDESVNEEDWGNDSANEWSDSAEARHTFERDTDSIAIDTEEEIRAMEVDWYDAEDWEAMSDSEWHGVEIVPHIVEQGQQGDQIHDSNILSFMNNLQLPLAARRHVARQIQRNTSRSLERRFVVDDGAGDTSELTYFGRSFTTASELRPSSQNLSTRHTFSTHGGVSAQDIEQSALNEEEETTEEREEEEEISLSSSSFDSEEAFNIC